CQGNEAGKKAGCLSRVGRKSRCDDAPGEGERDKQPKQGRRHAPSLGPSVAAGQPHCATIRAIGQTGASITAGDPACEVNLELWNWLGRQDSNLRMAVP